MKLDNLLLIINSKHFLKLAIIFAIGCTIATAGVLTYYAGTHETTVYVGSNPTNDQVYDITIDGVNPPFTIVENLSLLPDEQVMIQYLVRNNEQQTLEINFNVLSQDSELELTITDGMDNTLSNNVFEIEGDTAKYIKFWYHVLPTAQEGDILNALIEITVNPLS